MLAFTDNDQWSPGLGDPTVMGWVTVAVYLLAAALCGLAALGATEAQNRFPRRRWFWWVFCASLFLLGINKQLDLQTWLTLFLRHWAQDLGWYGARRGLQAVFIGLVAISGLAALAGLKALVEQQATRAIRWGLLGGAFLGCFVLVRASSFHHVDQMLGMDLAGVRLNWMFELGSLGIIVFAAWLDRHDRRARAHG